MHKHTHTHMETVVLFYMYQVSIGLSETKLCFDHSSKMFHTCNLILIHVSNKLMGVHDLTVL